MSRTINLAIVGLGHVAKYQIDAIMRLEDIRLLAACDTIEAKAKILGQDVLFFKCIKELLLCDAIDVVLISTPTRKHYSMGLKVLEAGKGLLLEKPAAENHLELKNLITISRENNIHMSIAFHAAFGLDVRWFYEYANNRPDEFKNLSGFDARFYDPYIVAGNVVPATASFISSWLDSGINALSIVGLFVNPDLLKIKDTNLVAHQKSRDISMQGTVEFRFHSDGDVRDGIIHTDWTTGRNHKSTKLFYDNSERTILLDHSAQVVWSIDKSGKKILYKCENGHPRLLNHYLNLFADFSRQFNSGEDNLDFAESIHSLLYQANTFESDNQ